MPVPASRLRRLTRTALASFSLVATTAVFQPREVVAGPWPVPPSSNWAGSVQDYPSPSTPPRDWSGQTYGNGAPMVDGPQAYGPAPMSPEQQAQRCNTGRLIGGLGGGAVAYTMSRGNGRAWAIPLGALLGSQVGCSVAAGRGPFPW